MTYFTDILIAHDCMINPNNLNIATQAYSTPCEGSLKELKKITFKFSDVVSAQWWPITRALGA